MQEPQQVRAYLSLSISFLSDFTLPMLDTFQFALIHYTIPQLSLVSRTVCNTSTIKIEDHAQELLAVSQTVMH